MSVTNGDSTEPKSWVKFYVEVSKIQQEIWVFVTSKDNSYISLLFGLPWLQSVDIKLFIQKEKIHIRNSKKREALFQISCSTILSEDTRFQASNKSKAKIDKSSKEKNTEYKDGNSTELESDD